MSVIYRSSSMMSSILLLPSRSMSFLPPRCGCRYNKTASLESKHSGTLTAAAAGPGARSPEAAAQPA
eukprot:754554-Hanusia_phi.AAC.4